MKVIAAIARSDRGLLQLGAEKTIEDAERSGCFCPMMP
jgi:hypothetical protein